MKYHTEIRDKILILHLFGDFDHSNSEAIKNRVRKELSINNCNSLIIDFSMVDFMDSSAIGMLIGRYKDITLLGGKIAVCGIKGNLERIYTLSGLYKIIENKDTIEKAIEYINGGYTYEQSKD